MQFYELVLQQLAQQDQQQLRQALNVAAVHAYISAKPGIHERYAYNHHNIEYEWGHGSGWRVAEINTHQQPPVLRLIPSPEEEKADKVIWPWKAIPLDESLDAATLQAQIDQAYAFAVSRFASDSKLLPLLDRSLPTLDTLHRLCQLHNVENFDPILKLVQPAIRILTRRAEEQEIDQIIHRTFFGRSHFGGQPDLPRDMAWPLYKDRPMAFLGQINVDDIGAVPGRSRLPEHGLFYFFSALGWGEDYSDGLDYEDPTNTRVIYYDGPLDREHLWPQRPPQGMPPIGKWGQGTYPYTTLQFVPHLSLPSPEEAVDLPEGVSSTLYEEMYYDFTFLTNDYFRHKAQHQLLGYVWPIQGFCPTEGETLLIQVDTDYWEADFQWGDGGMLYFVLPTSDLQNRDFSHCRCGYECG